MRNAVTLLAASALLAAGAAHAYPERYFYESQALTRATPTLSSEGMALMSVAGFRVAVCAESGQTLSGAGTLRAWLYHSDAQVWMRDPALDLKVEVTGTRCQTFPDSVTGTNLQHRVLYAADAITVGGGTTVTVYIDGSLFSEVR